MGDLVKKPESTISLARDIKALVRQAVEPERIARRRGNLLQTAFLFDTTGSMHSYYERGVRAMAEIMAEVKKRHQDVQFCYVPYKNHGDERRFDGVHPFFSTGFFDEVGDAEERLKRVRIGGGGDHLCALEDVFYYLARELYWSFSAKKAVVLIGDMPPHGLVDSIANCPNQIDYQNEIASLKNKGIRVYSVFCFREGDLASKRKQKIQEFYRWIASFTGGRYLELIDINDIVDLLIGICMKETGHLDEFIEELGKLGRKTVSKERLLLALKAGQ